MDVTIFFGVFYAIFLLNGIVTLRCIFSCCHEPFSSELTSPKRGLRASDRQEARDEESSVYRERSCG